MKSAKSFISNKYKAWFSEQVSKWLAEGIQFTDVNPLSVNPTKWSKTLKQFVGKADLKR